MTRSIIDDSKSIIDYYKSIIDDSKSIIDYYKSIIDDSRSIIDDKSDVSTCGITHNHRTRSSYFHSSTQWTRN
jgi:hypothetical protein